MTAHQASEPPNGKILKRLAAAMALCLPLLAALGLSWWAAAGPKAPPLVDLEAELPAGGLTGITAAGLAALETETRPAAINRPVEVRRGDTVMGIVAGAGAGRQDAHRAITAMRRVYSPHKLKPGQSIHLAFSAPRGSAGESRTPLRLVTLRLQESAERDIQVTRRRAEENFVAAAIERPLSREPAGSKGRIESSLFVAGREAGVPAAVMIELIRAFSFDVDFQREVWPGNGFEVLYESFYDEAGTLAMTGDLLYAALDLSWERLELYRFTPKSGRTDYFDSKGQSVRKTLMRTPIDGARISSGYGRRRHPVLGYNKMHRGTDFAAPRGTPIYAAGDGVVDYAGRKGGYGNYVRIRHNSTYKTAYAHMRGFAKGMRRGKRVKQGQVAATVIWIKSF